MTSVFSRKKFLFLREKEDMVKIRNKKKVLWAFRQFQNKKSKQKWLAQYLSITPQWFRVIYNAWLDSGEVSGSCRKLGRPKKETSCEYKQLILGEYPYVKNALYIEKSIYAKHKIRIGHNRIHMVLKENDLAKSEPNKSKRRKPWVRYERKHSLSAGHIDWHQKRGTETQFCAILDDSSRKILAAGEFCEATTENCILLVEDVIAKYGHIQILREMISDHGTQFCANKTDEKGFAEHTFVEYLTQKGIKQILCRIKHPQSNGKIEKFFHLYERFRDQFGSLDKFIDWYNNRPHGSLNLRVAETPNMAFERRIPPEYWFRNAQKLFNF